MNSVVAGVLMATSAVGVFGASVVGMLALSGRLNPHGVSNLPVFNQILKDDGATASRGSRGLQDATVQKPRRQDDERVLPGQGQQSRSLFTLEGFAPPTTKEEIQEFYAKTKAGYETLQLERAALSKRELELRLREDDLEQRRKTVVDLMDAVNRNIEELKALRSQFEVDITVLRAAEAKNMKRQAETLAAMSPEKASEYLIELGPDREDLAVKLLVSMEVERASAILGVMDSQRGARLLTKATRLLKQD